PTVTIEVFEEERALIDLAKFDLICIPPAPRGVPQVEASFEINVNGILKVDAVENDKVGDAAKNAYATTPTPRIPS
ncbi:Endoplasmic reticulum chaperone BiP, partial [Tulasnella sp. 408]